MVRRPFYQLVTTEQWIVSPVEQCFRPPTDVYEGENELVVRVEIGGVRQEDIQIELDNDMLRIQGRRGDADEKHAYHLMEIPFGPFLSEVVLPRGLSLDDEKLRAEYSNGMLKVHLPRRGKRRLEVTESGE